MDVDLMMEVEMFESLGQNHNSSVLEKNIFLI